MNHVKRNGFSLVELLAVIAVIGVLAGILIPIIGNVTQNARRAQATSNVRELGLAHLAYATEHEGKLPPLSTEATADGNTDGARWMDLILPYLGYDRDYPASRQGEPKVYPDVFYNPLVDVHFPWTDFGVSRHIYTRPGVSTPLAIIQDRQAIMLMDAGVPNHPQGFEGGWMIPDSRLNNPTPNNTPKRPDGKLSAVFVDGSTRVFEREFFINNAEEYKGPNYRNML